MPVLAQIDRRGKRADADLRTGEVGEHRHGLADGRGRLAGPADDACRVFVRAVGEVDPDDVHTDLGEGVNGVARAGRGSNGGDDLCAQFGCP
jgi:hypothetical protein